MTERHISDVEVGLYNVSRETPSSAKSPKTNHNVCILYNFLTNVKFPSIIANGFATFSPGHFQNTPFLVRW